MGGNIPGGNFLGGNLSGGNFPGWNFPRTLLTTGLKSEEFFQTYPRILIKFGMKVLFIN